MAKGRSDAFILSQRQLGQPLHENIALVSTRLQSSILHAAMFAFRLDVDPAQRAAE
jgi:hypothetical protein